MRCYQLTITHYDGRRATRLLPTQEAAREARRLAVAEHGLRRSDVSIDEHAVPTEKEALLAYVNELLANRHEPA